MLSRLGQLFFFSAMFVGTSFAGTSDLEFTGHESKFYVCTAYVTDDSGLFFMGMGRNMADAYAKAMNSCIRQKRTCTVSCEAQL